MTNPKISVIVPIYKVEKYLMQCIDSILAQTLKDIEVILVDEGDLDECRAIIDMYEFGPKKDERIRTLHEKNGGYGASCNKGFDIARGEYISIIESDDFIEPTMFEEMYAYAKKLDADVVKTPYYEYFEARKEKQEEIYPCFWSKWVKDVPENELFSIKDYPIFMGIHPSIWSCLYKTSYLKENDIKFLENKGAYVDHHFKALSLLQTDKISWLNKPFYKYRLSNAKASAAFVNLSVMIKRWNEFHKLMDEKFPNKYADFATYNIREEYVNTFEKFFFEGYTITEKDFDILKENLKYSNEAQIKEAKNLYPKAIKLLLKAKKNPKFILKFISEPNFRKRKIIKFLGIPILDVIKQKSKTYKIRLFCFLPLLKLKKRGCNVKKIYLFGLIPTISTSEGVYND